MARNMRAPKPEPVEMPPSMVKGLKVGEDLM